jgi:hypothetical protein
VIDRNPEADVGLIAVDRKGGAYARNSDRVQRRPDLGYARAEDAAAGAVVEVLHNAIRPHQGLAATVAAVILEVIVGAPQPAGWVTIGAGVPLEVGKENAVHCGADLVATRIVTTDPILAKGRHACAAIYIGSAVYSAGALVGRTMFEPITTVENGRIMEMSGQATMRMSFRSPDGA